MNRQPVEPQPVTIAEAATDCLDLYGYPHFGEDDGSDIRFKVITRSGRHWRTQLLASTEAPILRLFVYLTDDLYLASLKPLVIELACRLDEVLALGHFAVDWDAGAVTYRSFIDFRDRPVSSKAVAMMLNAAALPIRLWEVGFEHLINHDASPADAAIAALIEADAHETDLVRDSVRRLLIRVEDGGLCGKTKGEAASAVTPSKGANLELL